MKDRRVQLKVKIKSLAAEARIIRIEENKARDSQLRDDLVGHRKAIVRSEARYSLLAYAFIRGKAYKSQEPATKCYTDWKRVRQLVERFGVYYDFTNANEPDPYLERKKEQAERLEVWLKEAQE
jgi:hypothetical protein